MCYPVSFHLYHTFLLFDNCELFKFDTHSIDPSFWVEHPNDFQLWVSINAFNFLLYGSRLKGQYETLQFLFRKVDDIEAGL